MNDGEPISRGQLDRKRADAQALRDALLGVALFTIVVLVNGILAILFIAFAQAIGWWEASASERVDSATTELAGRLHLRSADAG